MNEALTPINVSNFTLLNPPELCHYLILALILFLIGIMIAISGRNMIKILIGLEFMLNAVCINFAAANTFLTGLNQPVGQVLSLIISAIGAMSIAAGFALIIAIYFKLKSIDTSVFCALKSAECPEIKNSELEEEI